MKKHILQENYERMFGKLDKNEIIVEGLLGDILKLPFKLLGIALLPVTTLIKYIIKKRMTIETKWKITKQYLDALVSSTYEYENALEELKGDDLSPTERKQTVKLVKKYEKAHPSGKVDINKFKNESLKALIKNNALSEEEKAWLTKQVKSYKPQSLSDFNTNKLIKSLNM